MFLSDSRIIHESSMRSIVTPYNPDNVNAVGIELTLSGQDVVVWERAWRPWPQWVQVSKPLPYTMPPRSQVTLATTKEVVDMPNNLVGVLSGKSTLARLGISNHLTAGIVDPGFSGKIVLELTNNSPVPFVLEEGMRIGKLSFHEVSGKVLHPYGDTGSYQHQLGVLLADEASLGREA